MAALATIPIAGPFLAYRYNNKLQGAFQEARNIQGSEAHASLFGQTSVFVSGQEHAALTSAKNVVVTANDQVEIHSRGRTEIAGGEAAYITSSKEVNILSRGTIKLHATGHDMAHDQTVASPHRFAIPIDRDLDRTTLELGEHGKANLSVHNKSGTKPLASIKLDAPNATDLGKLTLVTDGGQSITISDANAADACTIAIVTAGSYTVEATKEVIASNDKWKLCLDEAEISLSDTAEPTSCIGLDSDCAIMSHGEASIALSSDNISVVGTDFTVLANGDAKINGKKIMLG